MKNLGKLIYFIFLLSVSFICLLSGCIEQTEDTETHSLENKTALTKTPSTTSQTSFSESRDNERQQAESTLVKNCNGIYDPIILAACNNEAEYYNDVALKTLNQSLCEKAGDSIYECYTKIAEEKRDYNLCSNISEYRAKNSCYESLATLQKDPTICELVSGEATTVGGTIKTKSVCYLDVAVTKNDSSICNKIDEQFYKDQCIDYFAR